MSEVVGTVATAIVGLVGVSALLWTARLERNASVRNVLVCAAAEHRRPALIDKRQTYARYFGLVESTRHAVITIRAARCRPPARDAAASAWTSLSVKVVATGSSLGAGPSDQLGRHF